MHSSLAIRFLGVGNSQAPEMGSSACVLENNSLPILLIDCGPDTLDRFQGTYTGLYPTALFLTHTHFDHIGGLECMFYRLMTTRINTAIMPRLFVPVGLLPSLQRRVADYPNPLAEGGTNFWDAFQLVPVSERFWLHNLLFDVFPVRHHEYGTAFGIALQGRFLYTGDTRPIPEVLNRFASRGEHIFHDCCVHDSPSHSSLMDIRREYKEEQLQRLVLYHYGSESDRLAIEREGLQPAQPGHLYPLSLPVDRETKFNISNSCELSTVQLGSHIGLVSNET